MKYLFIILLTILSQTNYAQHISLETNIMNSKSEPIAYATVFLQNNQTATTSNFEGEAKLVINEKSLPDTLVIRHISYETQKFYLSSENIDSFESIQLIDKLNEVGLTEIRAYNAESVIKKVIDSIPKNYHSETFVLLGFYRQAHQENNKFVRLIECFPIVKEKIYDRNSTTQKESFHIEHIRRSNVYERNGDKHGDHLVDLFLEDPINYTYASFLNKQAYKQYEFSFSTTPNENQTKIFFQNKAWTEKENKSGYIIINKSDFAVLEMEITSTANPQNKTYNKSDWKFQNGTYKVQYEKNDGRYFCKQSSKYYNHYVLNEHTKNVEYVVEEYFDWFTETFTFGEFTDKVNQRLSKIEITENFYKYNTLTNLYSKEYEYNKALWEYISETQINDKKLDQKIIDDLNSFMDLEKQFEDD